MRHNFQGKKNSKREKQCDKAQVPNMMKAGAKPNREILGKQERGKGLEVYMEGCRGARVWG